jgi:nitrite reductase (NADH) small subunit
MPAVKVAEVKEVSPGSGKVVQAGSTTLALFNIAGKFYAIDNRCTHVGGPLGEGKIAGTIVTCPWHGSQFDVTTGQVVAGPARRPETTYPVRIQGGAVYVDMP